MFSVEDAIAPHPSFPKTSLANREERRLVDWLPFEPDWRIKVYA